MNLAAFHAAVTAASPLVVSVSIPDPKNRSTWVVQYASPPSTDQAAAVQTAIAAFDISLLTDRRLIEKALIIDRLIAAGKADAAFAAFDTLPRATREKWNTRTAIYADDADALALLAAIGANPNVIMAP